MTLPLTLPMVSDHVRFRGRLTVPPVAFDGLRDAKPIVTPAQLVARNKLRRAGHFYRRLQDHPAVYDRYLERAQREKCSVYQVVAGEFLRDEYDWTQLPPLAP